MEYSFEIKTQNKELILIDEKNFIYFGKTVSG
jgi:hypothetical protein